jgi:hypothetical protein
MIRNIGIALLFSLHTLANIFAQTIDFNWAHATGNASGGYGSVCLSMTKDNAGNLYCLYEYSGTNVDFDPGAGTAYLTSNGDRDMAIASYTSAGSLIWVKGIGGSDRELPRDIFWNNNHLYIAGSFSTTVDFDPNAGVQNKTSADMWDIFMLKLSDAGNFVWVNTFGGVGHDEGWQIKADYAGNVVITGGISSTVDFDPGAGVSNLNGLGTYDAVVAKFTSNGNYIWAKKIGNTGYDYPYSLGIDNANNIYYGGIFQGTVDFDPNAGVQNVTGSGGTDGFVASLDQNGNYRWVTPINASYVYSIGLDNANNVIITGNFNGTQDFDPGAGITNLTSNGNADIYLAKYTSAGALTWAFSVGGGNFDYGYEISIDMATNEIYTCGAFDGTNIDFNPGAGVYNQTSNNRDMYLACYTPSGGFKWARRPTGSSNDNAYYILFDNASQAVYMCGGFGTTVNFNVEGGTNNLSAAGNPDGHVEKYLQGSPLPIELGDFSMVCTTNQVEFIWTTYSELNNAFFTLEKSADLIQWEEVMRVSGAGWSNTPVTYHQFLTSTYVEPNEKYFRLKQTDYNGDYTNYAPVSNPCNFSTNPDAVLQVYPNPTHENITIELDEPTVGKLMITDVHGNVVMHQDAILPHQNICLANLPAGLYFIQVGTPLKIFTQKIIKF